MLIVSKLGFRDQPENEVRYIFGSGVQLDVLLYEFPTKHQVFHQGIDLDSLVEACPQLGLSRQSLPWHKVWRILQNA